MCVCVRAPLVPRHSWLGCAVPVCVLGLGFRLRSATPGWGVGACVCLCARSICTPPLLAGVCGVGVCAWARVSAAPRQSRLGCWGLCVFACALRLYPATPGCGVRCGCVCLGSGFGCAPQLLARVLGPVFVCVRAPLVPGHSWLGVRCRCVCLDLGFGCAPPLLAGVLGPVCVCVRAPLVPRYSWLGFVRCGCVCWGSGFGCAPPLLAGVLGPVCVCVRAPLVPRHSWLGCAVCVCVLGLGFRLRPATPGWGVGACLCLRARSACTPPLLAVVCGVGVCAWARVSAAPRHSWLGCWGLCVFVCALRLYLATPGCGVRCRCVCLDFGFGCAPPVLAGVLAPVCVCVRAPLVPRHSWLGFVRCGCVCWGSGFSCAPPLLAGVLGPVCVCVRAPLVPRHSWLGCAVCVCVLGLGFLLRPATPGWGIGACGCLCSRSACTPPLLAGFCGAGVCAVKNVPTRTGPCCTPSTISRHSHGLASHQVLHDLALSCTISHKK